MPRKNERAWNPVWRRRALWGLVAVTVLVGSLMAFLQAGRVRDELIDETTAASSALVHTALGPELTTEDTFAPAEGTRYVELTTVARGRLLADGTVEAVTIWSPDGTILFADDVRLVGEEVRSMRPTLLEVVGDTARSDVVRGVLRTFVPLEVAGGAAVAVELDRSFDPIRAATDPWRLIALVGAAAAVLLLLLLVRTFTRYGRRAEGFDEDALRAAVVARRRAEHDRTVAEERRDQLEAELERTRQTLREAKARSREDAKAGADAPRLREHLASTAEDLQRTEAELSALKEQLARTETSAAQELAGVKAELVAASAEIERLEAAHARVADRAAKAEEEVGRLGDRVSELQARPEVETELETTRRDAQEARAAVETERARAEAADARARALEDETTSLREAIRELKHRPDASAKLEAATEALEIAREQIRALTTRADEADALAERLRAGTDGREAALTEELGSRSAELEAALTELASTQAELRSAAARAEALHHEMESVRRETEAAGTLLAGERAEVTQAAGQVKALAARAGDAEAQLEATRSELASATRALELLTAQQRTVLAEGERVASLAERSVELQAEGDLLRADLDEARRHAAAEAESADRRIAELEVEIARIAELEVEIARIAELEAALARAEARAEQAEAMAQPSEPKELEEELEVPAPKPSGVDDSDQALLPVAPPASGAAVNARAPGIGRPPFGGTALVQVDAIVRQVVREAWSDRGRMVSVYAEPVAIEAEPGQVEGLLDALLERSLERTDPGNRLVVHVERAIDGALLSVEDGRPATDESMSPEAQRLAIVGGGWAAVEAHPGGGAIFRVWLPATAPVTEAARPA